MRLSPFLTLFCTSFLALASSHAATTFGPGSSPAALNEGESDGEEWVLSDTLTPFHEGISALIWNGSQLAGEDAISVVWAASDPTAAADWLSSIPGSQDSVRTSAFQSAISSWAISDPQAALSYLAISESIDREREIPSWVINRWLDVSEEDGRRASTEDRENRRGNREIAVLDGSDSTFFQLSEGTSMPIPEPSSVLLAGLGALGLLRRRRDS